MHHMLLAEGAAAATQSTTFWILAVIAVAGALGVVVARKAVHCAVLLAAVMLSLAVQYALAGAPFLAFVQVIVYTGAVLMLFLFVLMIVGVTSADSVVETIRGQRLAAGLGGIGLLVLLILVVGKAVIGPAAKASNSLGSSNVGGLATLIFTKYVFPFEVTSALLITAALGAMVLAHREPTRPKPTQRDLSIRRMTSGRPAPLPGPGTYALHNAVDMPALLPDGSHASRSLSATMTVRGDQPAVTAGQPGTAGAPGTPAVTPPATTAAGRAPATTAPAATAPATTAAGSAAAEEE
jgi:NADH-quinone oxidoreductase subunit J